MCIINKQKILKIFISIFILLFSLLSIYSILQNRTLTNFYSISISFLEDSCSDLNHFYLYPSSSVDDFSEELYYSSSVSENSITFELPLTTSNDFLALRDYSSFNSTYTISEITLSNNQGISRTYNGNDFVSFLIPKYSTSYSLSDTNIAVFTDFTDIEYTKLVFSSLPFSNTLVFYHTFIHYTVFLAPIFLGIAFILLCIVSSKETVRSSQKRFIRLKLFFVTCFFSLTAVFLYALHYFSENFQGVPLGQLLYHLHTPLEGTGTDSLVKPIVIGVSIYIGSILLMLSLYFILKKFQYRKNFFLLSTVFTFLILFPNLLNFLQEFEVIDFFKYTTQKSTVYEEYYVDARDANLIFPEKDRNLIYIFLESMETTYASKSMGGNMVDNYIPELSKLALENITFSGNSSKLNGPYQVNGATFTMGALAAQTSGVPINEMLVSNSTLNSIWTSENNYLPGVYTIGDVLNNRGYSQTFMIGSNANFAGRSSYFTGHGNYKIFDYHSAINAHYIPDDYYVWWGYEDSKLIEYAKTELKELSSQNAPFNLTMLTVDTHFTDGYVCEDCEDTYDTQYSNVISCSSKQIANFIYWIQQQDFYDNTTIVLCGDHCTMDSAYISATNATSYDRKMYFTIINPDSSVAYKNQKREFTSLDMYPTTLAALGISIDGDRLGLGTNIFSDTPTLIELYGLDHLNIELLKDSKFYRKNLLYTS